VTFKGCTSRGAWWDLKELLNRVLTKIRFEISMHSQKAKILLTKMKWLLPLTAIVFIAYSLIFIISGDIVAFFFSLIYWLLFWALVMFYVYLLRFKEIGAEMRVKPMQDEISKIFSEAIKQSKINMSTQK
jgi:hypothetical protein